MRKLHTLGIIKGEIMWEFEIIGELKDKDYILFIQENMASSNQYIEFNLTQCISELYPKSVA